jgi:elongation factor P
MKNVRTGSIMETALKGSDSKFKLCYIDRRPMQYIYSTGDAYAFMDNETYEQVEISEDKLEDTKKFLIENLEVQIDFYEGDIIGITLPEKIEYTVAETTEAVKGNTTNNAQKDATLDNGLVIKVPLFINQGERVIVSTIDGKYSSRA